MTPLPLLLIEDDAAVRETLVDILEDRGHEVVSVSSVAEAASTPGPHSVALVDVRLPDGSGVDVARALRANQPDTDIVFLAANASLETAIDALELGAVRYLRKPCPPSTLLEILDGILERRVLRREADRQAARVARVAALTQRLLTSLDLDGIVTIGLEEIVASLGVRGAEILRSGSRTALGDVGTGGASEVELGDTAGSIVRVHHAVDEPDLELLRLMCAQLGAALRQADMHRQLRLAHERLRASHRTAMEAEKQSAVGRLAAGIAHEIGTPLNVISGRAEVLLARAPEGPMSAGLQTIRTQIDRITRLVRQLLDFSRAEKEERCAVALTSVISEILPLVETQSMKRRVAIETRVPSQCVVNGSPHQLQQVVLNLVLNAVDAGASRIVFEGSRVGAWVEITVTDDGEGVPTDRHEMIFEPFFTTKPRGQGTGLGLAVVRGIVRDHGGAIGAEPAPAGGACFRLRLPADEA